MKKADKMITSRLWNFGQLIILLILAGFMVVYPAYGLWYIMTDTHEGQTLDYAEFREAEERFAKGTEKR